MPDLHPRKPNIQRVGTVVDNMPAYSPYVLESGRKKRGGGNQCRGKMLHSDTKTASSRVEKRKAPFPKPKSHLPFVCFNSCCKQRRDMIAANREEIEAISEVALALHKGNINFQINLFNI